MPHKRINRIVFYLNDEEEGRLDNAVDESGLIRADYLREVLDSVWSGAVNGGAMMDHRGGEKFVTPRSAL